jgi:c(7)-type cytochrome triheme protein
MMKKLIILGVAAFVIAFFSGPLKFSAFAEDVDHGGDIIYTQPVKAVIFSHAFHVEELEFDCDDCHEDLFEPEALLVQKGGNFDMECLREGNYCGQCHDGSAAFSTETQCARCHIGVKGYNARLGNMEVDEH